MIVSFDFDSTLSREDVQEYAKELLAKGVNVWVVTSRFDDLHAHRWAGAINNNDLYEVMEKVGIPKTKVRFTLMQPKCEYLYETNVLWHLDDDIIEIESIKDSDCKTIGIHMDKKEWRKECDSLLKYYYGKNNEISASI